MVFRLFRPSSSQSARFPRRPRPPHSRPAVEGLESRVLPTVQYLDLGPLRFYGDFTQSGTQYTAEDVKISLGLKPSSEAFLPLLSFDLTNPQAPGTLKLDRSDTTRVQFSNAAVYSVVGPKTLPLWQTAAGDASFTTWSPALLTSKPGQPVSGGQPYSALGVSFTLTALSLLNPGGGSTEDAEVAMQGSVGFPKLTDIDLSFVQASVSYPNYLRADTSGLHLDGLTATLAGPHAFTLYGMTANVSAVSVTYGHDAAGQDRFTFGFGATLQTQAQGQSGQRAFDGVAASLTLTVTDATLTDVGVSLAGGFQVFGLSVATDVNNPLNFKFNAGKYEFSGGLTVTIPTATASTIDVRLGTQADPGLVVQDGQLTKFCAQVFANFRLAALQVTTPDGLTFAYDHEQFELYGDLKLTVPSSGDSPTVLTASLGTAAAPGLVVKGSELQSLNMSLSGQFDMFGMTVQVSAAGLVYDRAKDHYLISGTISIPDLWNATIALRGTQEQPGIIIQDGQFRLHNITFSLGNVNLGVFVVQQLQVTYSATTAADFDLAVKLYLIFPAGWGVFGSLALVDHRVDAISLGYTAGSGQGIEVGDTGLFLTYLQGEVQNIDDVHNLLVSGAIAFTYGPQITVYDPVTRGKVPVTAIAAKGDFFVDSRHLRLDGDFFLAAYATGTDSQNEPQYRSIWGNSTATMDLDWGAHRYEIQGSFSWFDGVVQGTAALAFDQTGDLVLGGKVEFHVPDHIPFIGGKRIGSADGLFEFHKDALDKSFLAAWVDFKIPVIDRHVAIGAKFDLFSQHVSVIGGHTIDAFADCITNPEQCLDVTGWYDYFNAYHPPVDPKTNQIIATEVTLSVSWPDSGGTQKVTVGLPDGALIQGQSTTATSAAFLITSAGPDIPLPDDDEGYTLTLKSNVAFDDSQVAFAAVFRYPPPTVAAPVLGTVPTDGTSLVAVTLTGTVDEGLADGTTVSLYVDRGNDPDHRRGLPVKGATALPVTTDGQGHWTLTPTWDLADLTPSDLYYLYAVINDGVNAPVLSGYSAATRVVPPFTGRVLDTAITPQSPPYPPVAGLLAYLDLNHNGQYDPSEPSSITDASGLYSFWKVTPHTPYDVGLVLPAVVPPGGTNPQAVFLLDPTDPGNTNPRRGVTYDGVTPAAADFALFKLPSISGTAFTDLGRDGAPDPGDPGLAGWQVFLDANGNGRPDAGEAAAFTASDGSYSFLALTPGLYRVSVKVPPTYYQTFPSPPLPYYDVLLDATPNNPYPQYPSANFGALPFITVSGNVSQYTLQNGTLSPAATPVAGQTVRLLATRAEPLLINAGGAASDGYQADQDFSLPSATARVGGTIDTHLVPDPAPQQVYQTSRYGPDFSYTLTGLVPGAPYMVTLHFAETYWQAPGQRVFDVAINGQPVLTGFDILATAGGAFTAVSRLFSPTADARGAITIHFTRQVDNAQVNGIEVRPYQAGTVAVNAGGGGYGDYQADRGSSGGDVFYNAAAIDTSLVAGPAPQYVYQTFRYGSSFSYLITGLTPNAPHLVRLQFVEHYYTQTGQRLMDVSINGQTVLPDFDIFGVAHARNRAVAQSFLATADASGALLIVFAGQGNEALVNAIEVAAVAASTTTDAAGNYTFTGVSAGTYQVLQQLAGGTRQVAPSSPGLLLQPPAGDSLLPAGGPPLAVAAANLDGTGPTDLVVLKAPGSGVPLRVFFDAGQGNRYTLDTGLSSPVQFVTGDFYGTGRQDILVLDRGGQIAYMQNQGGQYFAPTAGWAVQPGFGGYALGMARGRFVYLDDVPPSRDQLAVLYVRAILEQPVLVGLDFLYVDASGNLQRISSAVAALPSWQPGGMVACDVTGNTLQDLLIGFASHSPLLGSEGGPRPGEYQFTSLDVLPAGRTVFAGDVNGDGYDDPGVFDSQAQVHLAIADAAGNFQAYAPGVGVPGHAVGGVLLRDLNGDFRPDLVWVSEGVGPQALAVALNAGQPGAWFTPDQQTSWALAPGAQGNLALDVSDLNADGLNDVVVADQAGGFVEIAYNTSILAPTPYTLTALAGDLPGNDFVNVQLGQVNGRVYDDLTRDGASLLAKPARAGVRVYVDRNRNGRPDPGEPVSVTGPHGWYSFSGLSAGSYPVRWLDETGRRPTSPEAGLITADLADPGRLLTGLDFGNAVLRDPTLLMPADGSRAWAVRRNRDRLEVLDRDTGVVLTSPLDELHSLTLVGLGPRASSVTVDLAAAGFFRLPGGLHLQGGPGPADTLRLLLGGGDNQATLAGGSALLDAGLGLAWTGFESVDVSSGPGRDRVTVEPQAAAISLDAGPPTSPPGDRLTVLGQGRAARLTVQGTGAGQWTFAGAAAVGFRGVETLTPGDFVWTLYRDVLGRDPDAAGHAYWREALDRGVSRDQLTWELWTSREHRGLQVDALYRRYLGREADPAGRAAWVDALLGGMSETAVAAAFLTSDEYRLRHAGDAAFLDGLYRDVLGRAPDAAGRAFYQGQLGAGRPRAAVAAEVLASPEAKGAVLDELYRDHLGRPADAAGRAYWLAALAGGRLTPAQVDVALLASDEFLAGTL